MHSTKVEEHCNLTYQVFVIKGKADNGRTEIQKKEVGGKIAPHLSVALILYFKMGVIVSNPSTNTLLLCPSSDG